MALIVWEWGQKPTKCAHSCVVYEGRYHPDHKRHTEATDVWEMFVISLHFL